MNGNCTDFIKDIVKHGRDKAKVNNILYPATGQSLLQKWLREKHQIHIVVNITIADNWYFELFNLKEKRNSEILGYESFLFTDYKITLEKALQETLKLI